MSMTETPIDAPKKIVKKKRKPQRRAAAPPPAPAKVPSQFAGITTSECCDGCSRDRCVITEINYCAHPFKGGLQSAQMNDEQALKRFNRAKAALNNQMIDLRDR
jgi:hypothetical protein